MPGTGFNYCNSSYSVTGLGDHHRSPVKALTIDVTTM